MINLIVNGNSYNYPQPGDKANTGWGSQSTNWASAVTAALTALGLGGTLTPTPNAVVDISSTTKGILVPRLTTTQRNAITSPATSLLIFNTTLGVFQYYTGSAWVTVGAKIPDGVIYADDNTTANTPVISFINDANTGIGRSAADTLDFITNGNSRFRIESTGQIKAVYESTIGTDYNTRLDNGYLCRAWVNFDGTLSNTTGTYTRSGTTITCTITSHGLTTGQTANLDFTTGGATDGIYVVTVTNANTFTVEDTVSGTITTSNVTMLSRMIRASGNVSSITDSGTGDYTVNFTTAMPDTNYSALVNVGAFATSNWGMPTTVLLGAKSISNFIGVYSTTQMSIIVVRQSTYSDENLITVGIFR